MNIFIMTRSTYIAAIFTAVCIFTAHDTKANSIGRKDFVVQLVHDLGRIREMRNKSAEEVLTAKDSHISMATSCIRNSTALAIELRSEASSYTGTNLGGEFSSLGTDFANILNQEAVLNDKFVSVCKNLLGSSDPVRQLQIASGETAELSAHLDFLDETIFKAIMPLAMFSLISERPDSKGQMSVLAISKAERLDLINVIGKSFGTELKMKNPPYIVASAIVLARWLQNKGYKASDEEN